MTDRDKVIAGLECCSVGCVAGNPGCPYQLHGGEDGCDLEGLMADALALIREQEPVRPLGHESMWFCGACRYAIPRTVNYCPKCGKKVKWNEAIQEA